jgi:hypothetical protein
VKLVLVALKCDLRERDEEDEGDEDPKKGEGGPKREMIDYNQGLAVARRIQVQFLFALGLINSLLIYSIGSPISR